MRVILLAHDQPSNDPLAVSLADGGHEVVSPATARARVAQPAPAKPARRDDPASEPWHADVLLVRLDSEPAKVLDDALALAQDRRLGGPHALPVLFTGGNELALAAARRRFPDASFSREDNIETALASLESDD